MDSWWYVVLNFGLFGYIYLLAILSIIYLSLIAPVLFNFWIIPRIENRYGKLLKLKEEDYPYVPFARWGMPAMEVSGYIFFKYIELETRGMKKTSQKESLIKQLKEINYSIATASRAEIIMSFITMFFFICFVLGIIFVFITDKIIIN